MTSEAVLHPEPAQAAKPMRSERELQAATRAFLGDSPARSWWYLASTLGVIAALIAAAVIAPMWWVRALAAIVAGLTIVRGFILFHDFMHGAILRKSAVARAIFWLYGWLVLTPPRVWRQTHNYHHAHTAKIVGSHVGSYPVLTTQMWKQATKLQRVAYRIVRHPLTIAIGIVTIFVYGMCISPLIRNPRKNWDAAVALVLHFGLHAVLLTFTSWDVWLFGFVLPLSVATAAGAYLFYAQHNFEGMYLQPRHEWSFTRAALESSSYMETGPIMRWFTGNIGYHHVHHLNPAIPFYRLPEAMDAIPELQSPRTTTLKPRDIAATFRLNLWDPERGTMVRYRDV